MNGLKDWRIYELTGYEPKTTFYTDLSIADYWGKEAILDTYERVMESWSSDVVFITEFCMALNWKIFEHHASGNLKYAEIYDELWRRCNDWCIDNLKDDDLKYFFRTTD